jgi:cell division septal protein FtsQ
MILAPLAMLRSAPWTRQLFVVALIGVLLVACSFVVWAKVRPHVQTQSEYLVPLSAIEITPPPNWIHADIRTEVIRDAGLPPKLSILDDRLSDRLTHAFALHPWISRVDRVQTSYPARIEVKLSYRRPVAMVAVYGGLLPIDADGVLLPTEDFTPQEAQKYPRVVGVTSSPLGPIGTRWGDPSIEAVAKLGALLAADWQSLQLHHIARQEQNTIEASNHLRLELFTRNGTSFLWGSPPGDELVDEIGAAEKMARLKQLASVGGLDAVPTNNRDLSR